MLINRRVEEDIIKTNIATYLESRFLVAVLVDLVDRGGVLNGFWRHVVECPDLRLLDKAGLVILDGVGNPKVYQFQTGFHKDEVGRFQITVYDAWKQWKKS